eukprot:348583_1
MTPISLIYLFMIDIVFMLFSLVSTVWLVILLLITFLFRVNRRYIRKYDIRDLIDDKIFKDWLNMNRTEIIAYRRLRTLSQLFFETMPQIVLQLRILWVIKWSGHGDNENAFDIDVQTLTWSIGLAIVHLILESGIVYFDKRAFRMSFMEYALECLGGRVMWIPFQHLINNIVKNQMYIHRDGNLRQFNKNYFDAEVYQFLVDNNEEMEKQKLLTLDYEKLTADMACFTYEASYQFSEQAIKRLIQILRNCTMTVPVEFKLSSTNVPLQNLMKQVLCKAQIKMGPKSIGNIGNISLLCELYQASFHKIRTEFDIEYENMTHLLKSAFPSEINYDNIPLDAFRGCFQNKFYFGLTCKAMNGLTNIIKMCYNKCDEDESWYFVVLFVLLYSRGNIFDIKCQNGCHSFDNSITDKLKYLKQWVPSYIEVGEIKIPFGLFENCRVFKNQIEEILVTGCKNYILTKNKNQSSNAIISNQDMVDIVNGFKQWKVFDGEKQDIIQRNIDIVINQLNDALFDDKNIALLDELVFQLQISTRFNQYLQKTLEFRKHSNVEHFIQSNPSKFHSFNANELLKANFDIDDRYQIYEMKFNINVSDFEILFGDTLHSQSK